MTRHDLDALAATVAVYQHLQTTNDARDTARRYLATSVPALLAYVRALERVIRFHNDGLQQQCDARAAGGMCDAYRCRGKCCVDCPRDFVVDAAAIRGIEP